VTALDAGLERECRVFTHYLAGREPTAFVVAKYRAAHQARTLDGPATRFDARLVTVARVHPVLAWAVDAAARFVAPRGSLRKKLVLLLAILETCPPFYVDLERLEEGRAGRQLAGVALRIVAFVPVLVAGLIVVLVLRATALPGAGAAR